MTCSRFASLRLLVAAIVTLTASVLPVAAAAKPATPSSPAMIDLAYAQSLAGSGQVISVTSTIQEAVDRARTGDVIFVPAGTYTENVQVRTSGLTIVGPNTAVLDGTGLSGLTGIDVRPASGASQINVFNLVGMTIQDYPRNGVRLTSVTDYALLSTRYANNIEYGLYPVRSTDGLIEGNEVSGSNDAGIYVGQSNQAIIRNNLAYDNTIGIEIENTINVETRNNVTRDNSVGVVGIVLPGRSIAMTDIVSIVENEIYNNNRLNPVTDPMDVISRLPSGIGILLIATDNVDVFGNSVLNNGSVGIGLLSLAADLAALDTRINPTPDNNSIFNNIVLGNGTNPDPKLALLGLPARDLLWDGTGTGNGWANNQFGTSFPRTLPGLSVAVPEPATWMLLLLGFGAVGYSMRSRRVGYKALQVD